MYPVFYVRFHCVIYVWERVWRLKTYWRSKKFSQAAHEKPSREVKLCAQHMIRMRRVMIDGDSWFSQVFRK